MKSEQEIREDHFISLADCDESLESLIEYIQTDARADLERELAEAVELLGRAAERIKSHYVGPEPDPTLFHNAYEVIQDFLARHRKP